MLTTSRSDVTTKIRIFLSPELKYPQAKKKSPGYGLLTPSVIVIIFPAFRPQIFSKLQGGYILTLSGRRRYLSSH